MFNRIFNFENYEVRIVVKDGEPWFVAKDVCEVLEIVDYLQAVNALDDDERGTHSVGTPFGPQKMVCVNESGLYHLMFLFDTEKTKLMRRHIFSNILPEIRKHGFYLKQG